MARSNRPSRSALRSGVSPYAMPGRSAPLDTELTQYEAANAPVGLGGQGLVAVIEVEPTKVTPVADAPPMVTVAPLTKFVPVVVTAVLPAGEPPIGLIAVTVGAGS